MIVTCTACQTKFRVPDEKIGEKAVKVRCSKCQNLFAVKRGADGSAAPVSLPAKPPAPAPPPPAAEPTQAADPFAAFGPPPVKPKSEATSPGVWHAGIAATRRPTNDFEETRPGVAFDALVASKLTSETPPVTVRAQNPLAPMQGQGHETVRAQNPLNTVAPAAGANPFESARSSATDPFGNVDLDAALDLALPSGPPPPPAADPFTNLAPAAAPPGVASFAGVAPATPVETGGQLPDQDPGFDIAAAADPLAGLGPSAPPPSEPAADPFGNMELAAAADAPGGPPPLPPRPAAPAADPFASLAPEAPAEAAAPPHDPFAGLDLAAAAPAPAEAAPAPAAPAADPFANLDLAVAQAPAADAAPVSFSFESGQAAATQAPAPAPGEAHDFFGDAAPAAASPALAASSSAALMAGLDDEPSALPGEPDRSMFDLPAAPPPSAPPAPISVEPAPAPAPSRPLTGQRPRPATTGARAPVRRPLGPRILGAVLNALFVVAVGWASLLTYATARADWHFDPALLRPSELSHAVFGGASAASQLVLEDVTSGSYEISGGRAVFFVRGELVNRGRAPVGPARAHVEVVEGDAVMGKADAWASATPVSPEQVYNLGDAKQLDALVSQQRASAQPLGPGEARPFLALLMDLPPAHDGRVVRIVPDLGTATAK